jgi:LPS sulfotransferase NodH
MKPPDDTVDRPDDRTTNRKLEHVSIIGRITKTLTGCYPRELLTFIQHYTRVRGITPGHLDYQQFIILGQERTGSSFLQSMLNSHRQIVTFGEIYQRFDAICWDYRGYRRDLPKSRLFAFQNDPIGFLETHVFSKFPRHIAAVGFKLFYTHARHPQQKTLWSYLRDHQDIKIIHIKRRNVLRTYLSLETAKKMHKWRDVTGTAVKEQTSIALDYEGCLAKFIDTKKQELKYDLFFDDHEKIEIFYEELAPGYQREMRHIQQFLGVEHQDVSPATHKQARLPLSDAILNYDELKARFRGTSWEVFFED